MNCYFRYLLFVVVCNRSKLIMYVVRLIFMIESKLVSLHFVIMLALWYRLCPKVFVRNSRKSVRNLLSKVVFSKFFRAKVFDFNVSFSLHASYRVLLTVVLWLLLELSFALRYHIRRFFLISYTKT